MQVDFWMTMVLKTNVQIFSWGFSIWNALFQSVSFTKLWKQEATIFRSFFPRDLLWPVNFTHASVYLWKVFFHSFCEQSSDQDICPFLFSFYLLLSVDVKYQSANI